MFRLAAAIVFGLAFAPGAAFAQAKSSKGSGYEQLNLFGEAFERVRQDAVEPVTEAKLKTGAVTEAKLAAEALREFEKISPSPCVHAVTDITGFGLLGHAREMALGDPAANIAAVSLEFQWQSVPLLPGALEAAREGMVPGGLGNNREFLGDCVAFADGIPEENRALFFDPQTSGGLLVAIAQDSADRALRKLREHGINAARIGRVAPKSSPLIQVS